MTPFSVRLGLVRWIATDASGRTVARCVASSKALAVAAIGGPRVAVSSEASNDIGWPERIRHAMAVRLCALCVKPLDPKASPSAEYHPACWTRHRKSYDATRQRKRYAETKKKAPAEPIPGGTLAEMRARLAEALEPGRAKGGRRRA